MKKWTKFLPNWFVTTTIISLIVFILFVLLIETIYPIDLSDTSLIDRLKLPSWIDSSSPYWLGTDQLGRDVFVRLLYATKTTVTISFTGMIGASIVGITLGIIAGYSGGKIDTIISFVNESFLSVPTTFIGIVIATILGAKPITLIVVIISTGWASFCRITRGQVLQVRHASYIETSKIMGASSGQILLEHVLPNAASPIIIQCAAALSGFILSESTLSFLGIGIQPPQTSLGVMISEGRDYLLTNWWLVIAPSIVMIYLILSISIIGDWLRDALDPKLRNSL